MFTHLCQKYGPIRVTTDIKTKEILAACRKKAIHAINVMSPMNEFDFRISMSVEEPSMLGLQKMPLALTVA